MKEMPRQFQPVPIASEYTRFPRIDVWKHGVENTSRLQPSQRLLQKLPWLIYMFQHVKAGYNIKAFRGERRAQGISDKNLCTGIGAGAGRHRIRDFNAMKVPRSALQCPEKSSGTATDVQNVPALLIL